MCVGQEVHMPEDILEPQEGKRGKSDLDLCTQLVLYGLKEPV